MRDTIELAREAGLYTKCEVHSAVPFDQLLKRFEALVRADERSASVQEPKQSPPFTFRRFVAGSERAQDVAVHREITLDAAIRVAAKICPPSESGHPTVLVYTPPPAQPAPATLITREQHIALREAFAINSADLYFEANPTHDNDVGRMLFERGFARGFDSHERAIETAKKGNT
jgi:hypothetical protein